MTAPIGETGTSDTDVNAGAGGTDAKTGASDTSKEFKIDDLPAEARAYLLKQVADAEAKARTTSKANAASEAEKSTIAKIAAALGMTPDGDKALDPKLLADQLAATKAAANTAMLERDLLRAARRHGGDDEAMIDSASFLAKLHKLDTAADDYATQLDALVKAEVEGNPRFKAAEKSKPAASTGAGGEFGGKAGKTDAGDTDSVEGMAKMLGYRK